MLVAFLQWPDDSIQQARSMSLLLILHSQPFFVPLAAKSLVSPYRLVIRETVEGETFSLFAICLVVIPNDFLVTMATF
jgi:hypothetical protein